MFPYRYHLLSALLCCCCLASCISARAQPFAIYDSLPQLEERIKQAGNSTIIINFWATWCRPCVEELPFFESITQRYSKQNNVQVLLVSLDFKSQLEKGFVPFLKTQQLKSEVILFADRDADTWIPRINEEWDGAIPATVVIRGQNNKFQQGKFKDLPELETFLQPFLSMTSAWAPPIQKK
jgi:thiol-disulfide isomerase/thioredoxin